MMQERGVELDPSTIMRWVHRYAPELEKRFAGTKATEPAPGA
ncbi:Mobile element protein (plasmid) [Acidisarcina polymorpha]|uniref:Mobile element protein n=1 Tax=Acidisarcina polymorpha TaxID=2211140 RepID=A0A2Z5GBC1_9BACT|nr:Mobile element protein [Acidisarcina polymorpha]